MKKIIGFMLASLIRLMLWFRYRFVIKGLDKLNAKTLNKPGGILFLPNHPAIFVDPISVTLAGLTKYPIRPIIVEYMYYAPILHGVAKFLNAMPMPNFAYSSNSLKRKKSEKITQELIEGLRKGESFLIYPAGKIKLSAYEAIGGSSAVHQIVQAVPEVNIVLVRTKGLWGSIFSSYLTGKAPPMMSAIFQGFKFCLKNLLFFTPRREVTIEFEVAPADFPYQASRLDFNRYLEKWYNTPDGLTPQVGESPGDSLVLVSYSMWGEKYLTPTRGNQDDVKEVDLSAVSEATKNKVMLKLAEICKKEVAFIKPEQDLAFDLGMDSLDMAELASFLQDNFEISSIPVNRLTNVSQVLGIASKQIVFAEEEEVPTNKKDLEKWQAPHDKIKLTMPEGNSVIEVFLRNCDRRGHDLACIDERSGALTYSQLKMRVVLLAEYLRHLPGTYVGILLPASVAANVLIMAVQLAGKVPLMVNWTVGPRHLEAVVALSHVEVVISSWAFLDKLENADLTGIDDKLVMLEDVARDFTVWDKLKAMYRSKLRAKSILATFEADKIKGSDNAVLLFTSGTEGMPKGVPLSHRNILSNLHSILGVIDVYTTDVIFGILPPFHAFGFTISALLGLLVGMRLASYPDPTNGKKMAECAAKWQATIVCGAPTFLKAMLKAASPEQLDSLRLCVTGAEKAPPELFQLMASIGKESSLIEGYGITECSPVLTANRPGKPNVGVGQALPNVDICIVHPETYEDVPVGTHGMILAHGDNIFNGYLNPNVQSPFVTHQGRNWYKTGDLGYLDQQGNLTIAGRQKRFIKIGGEMISLAALEETLLAKASSNEWQKDEGPILAVAAHEIAGDKPKIVLFTTFDLDTDTANSIIRSGGFSNLVKITSVEVMLEIPIMGTGKVNYRVLTEKAASS